MQFKAIFALAILGLCRGQDDVESLTTKVEDLIQSAKTYTFPVNNARFFESDGSTGDVCGKFSKLLIRPKQSLIPFQLSSR